MNFRELIARQLSTELEKANGILAFWEGGSVATKTSDEFSDLDANFIIDCDPQTVFEKIENILSITDFWNVTNSPWKGLTQRYYHIEGAPKYFFVDVCLFTKDSYADFLVKERHGEALVYFDKEELLKSPKFDEVTHRGKILSRLEELKAAFPFYQEIVYKEIERGNLIDALGFYQNAVLKNIITVLGMKFRPNTYDFGFRYTARSFPSAIQRELEDLFLISSLEQLNNKMKKAEQLWKQALNYMRNQ